jgi:hypothetical protein
VSGGFKRSSWFGLIGVFVVAALVALTMGQGDLWLAEQLASA